MKIEKIVIRDLRALRARDDSFLDPDGNPHGAVCHWLGHQHISLMRGSLAVIDSIVTREFNGQLIVASHAPEVWDHLRRTDAILDRGDPVA